MESLVSESDFKDTTTTYRNLTAGKSIVNKNISNHLNIIIKCQNFHCWYICREHVKENICLCKIPQKSKSVKINKHLDLKIQQHDMTKHKIFKCRIVFQHFQIMLCHQTGLLRNCLDYKIFPIFFIITEVPRITKCLWLIIQILWNIS